MESSANPIRRVVNLLQAMQKQVKGDGEKEEELYKKFMCYCTTGKSQLETAVTMAEEKIPKVTAALEEAKSRKAQLDSDIKDHKADRAEGKDALAKATALRAKEATAYAKLKSELETNLSAMAAAIKAIEGGMAGSFLQTTAAGALRRLAVDADMPSVDRDELTSFLSQGSSNGYAPKSGQISGILKQMKDTMAQELADATATEEKAIEDFEALSKAKTAEIEALTVAIEQKLESSGELGVEIVNMEEDIDDTSKALDEYKKFLAELNKGCDTKTAEWEERSKTRADELLAIHETIKILNDDDALELFKKALPAPSLVQVLVTSKEVQRNALHALGSAKAKDSRLALISMTLRGGAKSFDKVLKMIDEMVALLGEEQTSDDAKKAYCEKELDAAEDEKKVLDIKLSDLEKATDDTEESIATLTEEVKALLKGIKDLDAQVKEATTNREKENAFYKKTMQEDSAAKDILKMAKNRLAKFYAPKTYQPPAKEERSSMGRISEEMSLQQQQKASPGPPPDTWTAYETKSEEHGGVIAMVDLLIADLDKEMTMMTTEEKDAQKEYEEFVAEAGEKRATDSKSAEQKSGEKAELEAALIKLQQDAKDTTKEAYLKDVQIKDLHLECDWLISTYEVRKEARAGEVDSLKKAKAVLSGADYSLVQTAVRHSDSVVHH